VRAELAVGVGEAPMALEGEGLRLEMSRQDGRMQISLNGLSHCASLSQPTDYLLMREELGIMRRDVVFERTVASAIQLAYPKGK
jgi:hypothetical protein